MDELIKLAKMAGVMHEADHAYFIRSTWWLHWSATNVPVTAELLIRHVLLPITCDLSMLILESGLSYFRVLTICFLLVYFVSAVGCHCFDYMSFLSLFHELFADCMFVER